MNELTEFEIAYYPWYKRTVKQKSQGQYARNHRIGAFRYYLPIVEEFRENNRNKACEECDNTEDLQVDHYIVPFIEIVDDFLTRYNIDFHSISIYSDNSKKDKKIIYKCKDITDLWRK